jgi:putrescine aminotransferase
MSVGLGRIADRHANGIAAVRGRGLLWGVDFSSAALAGEVLVELAQLGLVVSPCLSRPSTVRLLPPLVASDGELAKALEILEAAVVNGMRTVREDVHA